MTSKARLLWKGDSENSRFKLFALETILYFGELEYKGIYPQTGLKSFLFLLQYTFLCSQCVISIFSRDS